MWQARPSQHHVLQACVFALFVCLPPLSLKALSSQYASCFLLLDSRPLASPINTRTALLHLTSDHGRKQKVITLKVYLVYWADVDLWSRTYFRTRLTLAAVVLRNESSCRSTYHACTKAAVDRDTKMTIAHPRGDDRSRKEPEDTAHTAVFSATQVFLYLYIAVSA